MGNGFTNMPDDADRPRGILTPTDRSFLRGEIEYEYKQQYSNRWADIRERITNGLLDFNEIRYALRDKDRKLIFREPGESAGVKDPPFYNAIEAMIYWAYYGLREQRYDFEGLLTDAVEQVERDFARQYWGESVDATVRFDVDVQRTGDVDAIVEAIEEGGPVKAESIYELLTVKGGVPIDTDQLDTVRVWFSSSYPEGEKAVLETLFSDYLGADVEIEDAIARVDLGHRESTVTDPDQPRPEPGEIKGRKSALDLESSDSNDFWKRRRKGIPPGKRGDPDPGESILDDAVDRSIKQMEEVPPDIRDFLADQRGPDKRDQPISTDSVKELLRETSDQFVSTVEVSAVFDCAPEAARQVLSKLRDQCDVRSRRVIVDDGREVDIWWLVNEQSAN